MEHKPTLIQPYFSATPVGIPEAAAVIGGDSIIIRKQQRAQTQTGFEIANWSKALQQRKSQSNLYYKGQKISTGVQLQYFRMYGSGIYLFFCFLWKVSIFFLFLSIISIIPITINYIKGNAYSSTQSSLQFYITRASIGNYAYSTSSFTYQQSINYKIANASVDIFTCFTFLIFYFYWETRSDKIVHQINNSIKLLSASTLEVIKFPTNARENDISQFMGRFGQVLQVASVKNYSNQIEISKDIYQARLEIKQMQIQKQISNDNSLEEKIIKKTKEAEQLQKKLDHHDIKKQQIIKFYVQFEKSQDRQKIIEKFKPYQKFCTCCSEGPPEEMLLNNQKVWVSSCETEPTGIIWQNVHITWGTRWLRSIVQFIIILLVIVGGFLFISFLNILTPPTSPNIDTSSYTYDSIKNETNTTIVRSWCIQNLQLTSQTLKPLCFQYWKQYIFGILITIGIAVAVVVLKAIIKIIMILIAKFQKYTSHTEQSVAIMTNLLITYISTTVLITFLIQANVFQISFKSFIKSLISDKDLLRNLSLISEYYDLTSSWYKDIGYQIWFNVLTLTFIPLYMPIISHLLQCVNQCFAKGQKLHKKMYDKIRPSQFQIEDNYANVLMIILIGFVFGGGSPCMIVVSFFGLILRYVYFKYNFIRFNRVPRTYNQALNKRALTILKVTLLLRCFLSLYMFGADDIFAMQKSAFMKWSQSLSLPVFSSIFVVISRIFLTWYYSIFVIFFILCFLFKDLLVDNLIKLCKKQQKQEGLEQTAQQLNKIEMVSQRILTKSYKLEKNPDYLQILAIMKLKTRMSNYARQSIVPVKMGSVDENEKI